jgi:hypothetical protein
VIVAGNQWKAAENEEISRAKHFAYLFGIGRLYSKHLSPFWAREKLKRNKVETGL